MALITFVGCYWGCTPELTVALSDFEYLSQKCEEVTRNHRKFTPVRDTEASDTFMVIEPSTSVNTQFVSAHKTLFDALEKADSYEPILLNDYLPSNPKSRYVLLQELNVMLPYRFVRFTHARGNNKGNIHFLWKIPMDTPAEELLQMNHSTATCVKATMDTYTRAMRHEALQSFGRNCDAKPAVLRELYHRLTGCFCQCYC